MSNPLEQFVIKPIIPLKAGDVDISFTNSSLFMLLAVAAVLFWVVYAAGQRMPARFCPALRRLAGWCYGVYLVHHVLLTLVFLRFVARFNLPLAGMFPVYLAVSFALAAVLTAVSRPLGKAIKKLA